MYLIPLCEVDGVRLLEEVLIAVRGGEKKVRSIRIDDTKKDSGKEAGSPSLIWRHLRFGSSDYPE